MSLLVEIWGKDNCPYCDKAKALAERTGHDVIYKKLGQHFEMGFIAEEFPEARTFPQITMDGNYIGGFTELDAHLA